jgi:hypothetical protein
VVIGGGDCGNMGPTCPWAGGLSGFVGPVLLKWELEGVSIWGAIKLVAGVQEEEDSAAGTGT